MMDSIVKKIKTYLEQGLEYYKKGEIDGALINLLNGIAIIDANELIDKFDAPYINDVLNKIANLQDMISDRKKNKPNDEEQISCKNIYNLIFSRKNDCIFFDDITGMEDIKKKIIDSFINPLLLPKLYPTLSKAILFYGSPGTGKTLIAKASVNQLQKINPRIRILFYNPTGASLRGKYVGETEKNIVSYYKCANDQSLQLELDSRMAGNDYVYYSIIFLDEIEAIAGDRDKDTTGLMTNSVNTLLQVMQGLEAYPKVITLAATNYPWKLDSAILRRFNKKIFITLPDSDNIFNIIQTEIYNHFTKSSVQEEKIEPIKIKKVEYSNFCLRQMETGTDKNLKNFKNFMPKYVKNDFRSFSTVLQNEKYSASDIFNLCSEALLNCANKAISNNKFVKTDINSEILYVSDLCFTEKQKNVYLMNKIDIQSIKINNNIFINNAIFDIVTNEQFKEASSTGSQFFISNDKKYILYPLTISYYDDNDIMQTKQIFLQIKYTPSGYMHTLLKQTIYFYLDNIIDLYNIEFIIEEINSEYYSFKIPLPSEIIPTNLSVSASLTGAGSYVESLYDFIKNKKIINKATNYKNDLCKNSAVCAILGSTGGGFFGTDLKYERINVNFQTQESTYNIPIIPSDEHNKIVTYDVSLEDFITAKRLIKSSISVDLYNKLVKYNINPEDTSIKN
jgi:SpoVK/Ycf46/Vps4 family AAA+-type ATPase